jgi:hypothetical protein
MMRDLTSFSDIKAASACEGYRPRTFQVLTKPNNHTVASLAHNCRSGFIKQDLETVGVTQEEVHIGPRGGFTFCILRPNI